MPDDHADHIAVALVVKGRRADVERAGEGFAGVHDGRVPGGPVGPGTALERGDGVWSGRGAVAKTKVRHGVGSHMPGVRLVGYVPENPVLRLLLGTATRRSEREGATNKNRRNEAKALSECRRSRPHFKEPSEGALRI